jgi:GNAT superfamily N-acetyltransferase
MMSHVKPDDIEPSGLGVGPPEFLHLRPIGIDDWSAVRYVHDNAFRSKVAPHVEAETVEAFLQSLREPDYADRLGTGDLTGAWLHGELVGTAGWRRVEEGVPVARIEALFVRPLFAFMGIGATLLAHAERRAREAGCTSLTATVPAVSVPFMLRFGYDVVGYGADLPNAAFSEPLFFMRKRNDARDQPSGEPAADAAIRPRVLVDH